MGGDYMSRQVTVRTEIWDGLRCVVCEKQFQPGDRIIYHPEGDAHEECMA
jgi:hypothetical protein